MLTYLAAIDYQNLDNSTVSQVFAEAAKKQVKIKRAVIVHADSDLHRATHPNRNDVAGMPLRRSMAGF